MSENGEIYTADKNFTLPPAVTAVTNSTFALIIEITCLKYFHDLKLTQSM